MTEKAVIKPDFGANRKKRNDEAQELRWVELLDQPYEPPRKPPVVTMRSTDRQGTWMVLDNIATMRKLMKRKQGKD